MWVLAALVAVLAAAVIWQTIHGKNELSPKPAAVASSSLPSAVGKPEAGILILPPAVKPAPMAAAPIAVPAPKRSESDENAVPPPPGKASGIGGDANPPSDHGKTEVAGGGPGETASQGGGRGVAGSAPDKPSINERTHEPQLSADQMVQNAQTALARGNLISPRNDSALYWVRRARQADPQNRVAIQIEDMILVVSIRVIEADRKGGRYENALRNLDMLQSLYPNRRDDLGQLRSAIVNEQQRSAYAPR
jgi:hypothetical protein